MNIYYIGGMPISDELYHYGVPGQSWGRRRFQNADGSLTALGRDHYGVGDPINPALTVNKNVASQTPATYSAKPRGVSNYSSATTRTAAVSSNPVRVANAPVNPIYQTNSGSRSLNTSEEYSESQQRVNALTDSFSDMDKISSWLNETDDVLQRGAKSKKDVEALQRALVSMGYKLDNFGIDGKFGAETEGALNKFKKDMGLKEDGILDFETSRKLQGAIEDHISAEKRKQISPTVKNVMARNIMSGQQQNITSPTATQINPVQTASKEASDQQQIAIDNGNSVVDNLVERTLDRSHVNQNGNESANDDTSVGDATERKTIATAYDRGKTLIDNFITGSLNQISSKATSASPNTLTSKVARYVNKAVKKAPKTAKKIARDLKRTYRSTARSMKESAKARRRMYSDISRTMRTVSVSAASVSKDVKRAVKSITDNHNKLVKDARRTAKSVERYFDTQTKAAKKRMSSISRSPLVESGRKIINRIFG